jgi:hypothetical protein
MVLVMLVPLKLLETKHFLMVDLIVAVAFWEHLEERNKCNYHIITATVQAVVIVQTMLPRV